MKKREWIILIAMFFSIVSSSLLVFFDKYGKLKENIVRVHILANSNSIDDQLLKYKVKDKISSKIFELLAGVKKKDEAKDVILNNLDLISKISKNSIVNSGAFYDVDVSLSRSYFPTRRYSDFVLPAGNYDALKVIIGEGKGNNWWCVAFPPMCSPIYNNEKSNEVILGLDQLDLIKNPCEFKFAVVELVSTVKNYILDKCGS